MLQNTLYYNNSLIKKFDFRRSMTTSKAKYHVAIVLAVAFVFNSWIFITAEPGENGCDINLEYVSLYTVSSETKLGTDKETKIFS